MNSLTLGKLYAGQHKQKLNATQMISLHLLLHRPKDNEKSLDPMFGPYISTLPREFDSHPLTWRVRNRYNLQQDPASILSSCLPPCIATALVELEARFWADFQIVLDYSVGSI